MRDAGKWRFLAVCSGLVLLSGCDEGVRAAFEDGIINVSTSLLTSIMQAIIALAGEANSSAIVLAESAARSLF